MTGIHDNEAGSIDREVRAFVRSGAAAPSPQLDARVLAALAAPGALAAGAPPRRHRWLAAAALLLGAGVTLTLWWETRRGARGPSVAQPGEQTGQDPARRPEQPAQPPVAPLQDPIGFDAFGPAPLSAAETVQRSPLVAVVTVHFPSGVRPAHGYQATVLRVLQGDRDLAGKDVYLPWRGHGVDPTSAPPFLRSFDDDADLAVPGAGRQGAAYLMTFEPMARDLEGIPAKRRQQVEGLPWFRSPFCNGLPATQVGMVPPARAGLDALTAMCDELLACLRSDDDNLRRSAVRSFAAWESAGKAASAGSPWLDAAASELLLARAGDRDARVREHLPAAIATLLRTEASAELVERGKAALRTLLLDRHAAIRSDAAGVLRTNGDLRGQPVVLVLDPVWATFTSPALFGEWRAWLRAGSEPAVVFAAMLRSRPQDHLLGALGLGCYGKQEHVEDLLDLLADEDLRVRAAAAWACVKLQERRGFEVLRALATGVDVAGAVQALDLVRELGGVEALDILLAASRSGHAVVRGLCAAGLRELRALGQYAVVARLLELRADPDPFVQLAAGAP